MYFNKTALIILGTATGLSFAPFFFTPGILILSALCSSIHSSQTRRGAFYTGYFFGFGFFLSSLYWISIGPSVYLDQFWWVIPVAFVGIPAFMALFIAFSSLGSWYFRNNKFYHFIFCLFWLFSEWLTSWLFTGLPWTLIGYALSFSDVLLQGASLFGVFGLSFLTIYVGSSFYVILIKDYKKIPIHLLTSAIITCCLGYYGYYRLTINKTEFTDIKVRLVQPSIKQTSKWEPEEFWQNLDKHIELSRKPGNPDIIIWSEAALTVPFYIKPVFSALMSIFTNDNQVLIFGAVTGMSTDKTESQIFSSLVALGGNGSELFEYHKTHLVPFGEYVPFKSILPMKKITYGLIDYVKGERKTVVLDRFQLRIQPMICYESIFPMEVRINNNDADVIINVTNDSWYGKSSGPYQHFEISKMRAIENGLPMLRVGNNGISAIIDPIGKVLKSLDLNRIGIIDSHLPKKINSTPFSVYGYTTVALLILLVLILQVVISFLQVIVNK